MSANTFTNAVGDEYMILKRIMLAGIVLLSFITGCMEEPRKITPEDICNIIWTPVNSQSAWRLPFCLRSNGGVLLAGLAENTIATWAIDGDGYGFTVYDVNGNGWHFNTEFMENGVLKVYFNGMANDILTGKAVDPIKPGSRYVCYYIYDSGQLKLPEEEVYVFFDYDNRIRGFSGVNNFFGQYELKTLYSIDIGPLATTRRGGAYLDYERYFLKMLGEEINTALKYNDGDDKIAIPNPDGAGYVDSETGDPVAQITDPDDFESAFDPSNENCRAYMEKVQAAISELSTRRGMLGAYENRMQSSYDSLSTRIESLESAKSVYVDSDIAEESTNFAQQQIMQQINISILSSANAMQQSALALLGG